MSQKFTPLDSWREREASEYEPTKGVFLVTTTIAFVSFERDLSMNTDS